MRALHCKIHNDPYYRGVQVDNDALQEIPEIATDVSHMINAITLPEKDSDTEFAMLEGVPRIDDALDGSHTT